MPFKLNIEFPKFNKFFIQFYYFMEIKNTKYFDRIQIMTTKIKDIFDSVEFQFPPDIRLAEKHQKATRIWRGVTQQQTNQDVCQCCNRKVGQQNVQTKCMYNSSEFSFLGPGIPLFFKYLKYSIILLVLFSLIFSIFGIYSNIMGKDCSQNDEICVVTAFNQLSIVNKKDELYYMRIQNYILLSFVIVCILLFQAYRIRFRTIEKTIDDMNITAGDYSIILKGLPVSTIVSEQLLVSQIQCLGGQQKKSSKQLLKKASEKMKNFIERMIDQGAKKISSKKNITSDKELINPKIQSIILSYDLTEYLKEKQLLLQKFKQNQDGEIDHDLTDAQLPQINALGQIAIVVFEEQNMKKNFIHDPSIFQKAINYFFPAFPPLSQFQVNGTKVAIEKAPEPEDILWQNAHITPWQRMKRKLALNSASFLLLMGGGACQYALALWQSNIDDANTKVYIGTFASILVTITNFILSIWLVSATRLQRLNTETQYLQVLTFKLVMQQFLNSGVFVVAANVLANFKDSFLETSLAQNITQIMILNALTPNVTNFLMKKFNFITRLKRYVFVEKQWWFITTQIEANKLYELPKPDFTDLYSYVIKTLWLTAFYAPLVPVVIPISVVGLTLHYFIQKILFAGSYSVSSKISATLNNACIQGLEYIPLITSVGEFLIYIYLSRHQTETPYDWMIPIYVCLALSFANVILPMGELSEEIQYMLDYISKAKTGDQKVKTQKAIPINKSYGEAMQIFEITYQMTNPAYSMKRSKRKDTFVQRNAKAFTQTVVKHNNLVNLFENRISHVQIPSNKEGFHEQSQISQTTLFNTLRPDNKNEETVLIRNNQTSRAVEESSTELMMVKKDAKQRIIRMNRKETCEQSTAFGDYQKTTQSGQIPFRIPKQEPEPGLKQKHPQGEGDEQDKAQISKLFEKLQQKMKTNKLIEIKEEFDEQEK